MVIERSRRDFLKQASLLAAASGTILRSAQGADEKFVVADNAFGKVRGTDAEGIETFKGIPYGANTAGKNRFMPPIDPNQITIGQIYAQFEIPATEKRNAPPVIMVHGSTHTAACLESTPDGREGWYPYFVRKGIST